MAQWDIKDYFYSLQLPESLRPLFCMPAVPAECLHKWRVAGGLWDGCDREGWVFPTLQVVPMGWNWAMYISQRVHQHQAMLGSGLGIDRVLVDNKPAPDLRDGTPVLLPYADNLNVTGIDPAKVQAAKEGAVTQGIVSPIPDRLQWAVLCF